MSITPEEELLDPKEEPQEDPQDVVEKPQAEHERAEAPTHANTSKYGMNRTKETNKLLHNARENVGEPTSQRRQRRSLDRYTWYTAMVCELVKA